MNVISRGVRNALRSPLKSGAVIVMLAVSIGLVLAMLVARSSVDAKISEIKATTATGITISPAGVQGGMGGGDALTADQVKTITATPHISNVSSTLTDQLGTADTNLVSSLTLGNLGQRQMRFEQKTDSTQATPDGASSDTVPRKAMTPRTTVTGTSDATTIVKSAKLTSGAMINGNSEDLEALVGKTLAEKNSLSVGSTFTAYGKTITVKGIFSNGSVFQDSGVIMPLATVQTLTNQAGAISSVTAAVDSSDNVASTVTALKSALGDKADIVSQQEQAANSVKPLESIANLALTGVIGAAIAGAIIVLLSMIMIVRERRREIGVIKAIGGTNIKVIAQFMTEALTLTIIGGIIGLGLGVAVSGPITQSLVAGSETSGSAVTRGQGSPQIRAGGFGGVSAQLKANVTSVTSTITPQIFMSSIGIMLLIAIIGSAVPAWAIARIRPAEVLRSE
jgi:putative ABC transport system permease protein